MALWKPPNDIGANEHIGRRIFRRQNLKGAQDQRPHPNTFELHHFEETRGDGDVSLDRLGATSIDGGVRRYLHPRAEIAGEKMSPPGSFTGWAVVRAKDLQAPPRGFPLPPIASPDPGVDGVPLSDNKFHAHVVRPADLPAEHAAYVIAMHLKTIFERKYRFEEAFSAGAATPQSPLWLARLRQWANKLRW